MQFFMINKITLNEYSDKCYLGSFAHRSSCTYCGTIYGSRNDGTFLHVVPEEKSCPFNSTSNKKG